MKVRTFHGIPEATLNRFREWFDTKNFENATVTQCQSERPYEGVHLTIIVVYVEKVSNR